MDSNTITEIIFTMVALALFYMAFGALRDNSLLKEDYPNRKKRKREIISNSHNVKAKHSH